MVNRLHYIVHDCVGKQSTLQFAIRPLLLCTPMGTELPLKVLA